MNLYILFDTNYSVPIYLVEPMGIMLYQLISGYTNLAENWHSLPRKYVYVN